MKVHAKLAKARVMLQELNLKKTGKNRNFNYFELSDFLPAVNKIFNELGLCSVIKYSETQATLEIFNSEAENESILFTCPLCKQALPSGTEIQNLGAIQTYSRRYLYLTAMEICESDAVDCLEIVAEKDIKATNFLAKAKASIESADDKVAKFEQLLPYAKQNNCLQEFSKLNPNNN